MAALKRASHIKRRKEIWEAMHPSENRVAQVAPVEIGYGKPPVRPKEFASETAAVSGESKSQINRHVARAEALGNDINDLGRGIICQLACGHPAGTVRTRQHVATRRPRVRTRH